MGEAPKCASEGYDGLSDTLSLRAGVECVALNGSIGFISGESRRETCDWYALAGW